MLKFSAANAKLAGLGTIKAFVAGVHNREAVYSFDLPAGYACPGAKLCSSRAVKIGNGWKIKDGKDCKFRCYSASQEAVLPSLRRLRHHNLRCLKALGTREKIAGRIMQDIPKDCTILRLHTSGDFFSQAYFEAWLIVAKARPDILIYAYTKAINLWVIHEETVKKLRNFKLVASMGGKWDEIAKAHRFRTCEVVYSYEEAEEKGIEIDHDDSIACGIRKNRRFATLLHGTQPEGSEEGKAVYKLRKAGLNGYRRNGRGYGFKEKRGCKVG